MPRYTNHSTIDEFSKRLLELCAKNDIEENHLDSAIVALVESFGEGIGCSKACKDLAMYGLFENYDNWTEGNGYLGEIKPLLGLACEDGVTLYGMLGAQDYTTYTYFVIYFDDKGSLRAYVPKKGNSINPLTKELFGEHEEADNAYAKTRGFDTFWGNQHSEKMEVFNAEKILDDVLNRIKLKN